MSFLGYVLTIASWEKNAPNKNLFLLHLLEACRWRPETSRTTLESLFETNTGFHSAVLATLLPQSSLKPVSIHKDISRCLQTSLHDKYYKMRKIISLALSQDVVKVLKKFNSHINLICFRTLTQETFFFKQIHNIYNNPYAMLLVATHVKEMPYNVVWYYLLSSRNFGMVLCRKREELTVCCWYIFSFCSFTWLQLPCHIPEVTTLQ